MDSELSKQIGLNIRKIRKRRGLTMSQVADRYSIISGTAISSGLIGSWERSERRIFADQAFWLAKALQCHVAKIYDMPVEDPAEDDEMLDRINVDVRSLPPEEQKILLMAAESWNGNTLALIQCVGLYMSLGKADRSDISFILLHLYRKALEEGRLVKDAPEVNVAFIEQQWNRLLK